MALACAVVAARPALSRVFDPPAYDLELAQQRRCDAAGGGDERWRRWRAATERGDADAVQWLGAGGDRTAAGDDGLGRAR